MKQPSRQNAFIQVFVCVYVVFYNCLDEDCIRKQCASSSTVDYNEVPGRGKEELPTVVA